MARMRKFIGGLADVAVLALAVFAIWGYVGARESSRATTAGSGTVATGAQRLDSIRAQIELVGATGPRQVPGRDQKATLLLFFNTKCPACLKQRAGWVSLAAAARSHGAHVVAVTGEEVTQPLVTNYFAVRSIDVTQARETEVIGRQLAVDAVPTTVLLDGSGRVLFRHEGELGPVADSLLRRLLAPGSGSAP